MDERIVVLGAGFGGLELSTILSEELGEAANVTLIDKGDAFVFGYSKLDVLFGREAPDAVRLAYRDVVKPGVRLLKETVTAIHPDARRVTTDAGVHEADILVVALGADYDYDATPGLTVDDEFYSVAGAERLASIVPTFSAGHAVIGVCGAPFKCPPAPSECALLLHDELTRRGVRDACRISFVIPFGTPVPPRRPRPRSWRRSPSATSTSSAAAASPRSTPRARSPCSTTARSSRSTSSSACRSTARPTS
jgi:sulfide:quinone oxidoreductase